MSSAKAVIDEAVAALRPGTSEPLELREGTANRLRAIIKDVPGPELGAAIAELCVLACWLEVERGCPRAKSELLDVAAESVSSLHAAFVDAASSGRPSNPRLSHVTGAANPVFTIQAGPAPQNTERGGVLARAALDKLVPPPKS